MGLLYFWRAANYRHDMQAVAFVESFQLQQNSPTLGAGAAGDVLFALTRRDDGRYVLAARMVIRAVGPSNADDAPYGRFTAHPEPDSVILFDVERGEDLEPLVRASSLSISVGALERSFLGPAAVRRIDDGLERQLATFADRQPRLPVDAIGATRALVLVEQEATIGGDYDHWADITGERYHFPNQYRRMVHSGLPFVYYRGTRRADGGRGTPGYFGTGHIDAVWRDVADGAMMRRNWRWYCGIRDYVPFAQHVPWKIEGQPFERIPRSMFRNGVRKLPMEVYRQIVELGGITAATRGGIVPPMPPSDHLVVPTLAAVGVELLAPMKTRRSERGSTGVTGKPRRSRYAAMVGRQAERVALKYLASMDPQPEEIVDVAGRGETPGWDLEYVAANGTRYFVEVKGTAGARFPEIEVSANEWAAARSKGDRYRLMLVANCLCERPVIQFVDAPHRAWAQGALKVEPAMFSVRRVDSE